MVTSLDRGLECPTAIILSDAYYMATADYFEAVDNLCSLVGTHEQFASAREYANRMHVKCRAARSALEKHRVKHGCFTAS
jgi:hypothetical protein